MLKKNPDERITVNEMKHNKWLNEGYSVNMAIQGADLFANLSDK